MPTYRKRLGRWRVEVVRQGVRKSATFNTKAEASAWAAREESAILEGRRKATAGAWTMADALARYATDVSHSKRGARWEAVRLRMLSRDPLASVRLRAMTGADLSAWRDRRLKVVAPGSVLREMNLLRSVLEAARRDWGWLAENPLRDVRRPAAPPHRDRRISDDEITRISLALGWDGGAPTTASAEVAVMFRLAIETGMRAGEIAGLTWARIDLAGKFVTLDRTKNGDARKVPLSSEAIRLLSLLPKRARVWMVSNGVRDALFRKARDRAGIVDLRFHDARHEAVSRLARRLDILDLARMIGHRDLGSLRIYYNPTATEIADRLG
jgi:integrase